MLIVPGGWETALYLLPKHGWCVQANHDNEMESSPLRDLDP